MRKSFVLTVLSALLALSLTACGGENNDTGNNTNKAGNDTADQPAETVTLTVGATAVPHAEILKQVEPALLDQGVKLVIKEFTDYVQPNVQVYEKQLDANFFQHKPYLEQFNQDKNMDLVEVAAVHIEPFGAYSRKITSIEELKHGATVAIPNDPSNGGRALALLEKNGLIKLKEGVGIAGTVKDIVDNPHNLTIKELEAAMLPRVLDEVDLALINTNYALEANLTPTKDALFIEDKESPYANILVARPDNQDSDAIRKLAQALTSEDVRTFIESNYGGAIVPAF